MENLDYETQFEKVKKDVVATFTKALSIQAAGTNREIKVNKVWIDDLKSSSDWESQRDAVRKDKTWGVPVYASLDLVDRKTGKVFSSTKRIKVATLPKNTDLGSFIVEGKHYQVQNQLRRKPGIYVTEKKSGEKKTEINIAGRPFDIMFDEESAKFSLIRGQNKTPLPLYPILSRLGISDSALAKAWGQGVLDSNKALDSKDKKKHDASVIKAAEYFTKGSKHDSPDAAAKAIGDFLMETEIRPEVTKETVGKAYKRASPDAIMRGSSELLKAAKGLRKADDRQALEFKKIMGMRDLVKERLIQPNGELAPKLSAFRKKIFYRLNNRKAPPSDIGRLVSSNELSPLFSNFFSQSSLSTTTDQTNPLNILNGMSKVTILGEGGVMTEESIRDEERGVHPSHMGFIDPIHTPDSAKIGVVSNLPVGVRRKGDDLQTRIIDPRTKKSRFVSPSEVKNLTLAFPDQYVKGAFVDKKVMALVKSELRMVDSASVDAVLASPKQAFSISSNTIPFLPSVQGVRGQMATKMLEQAIPLANREAPLVRVKAGSSTIEDGIGEGFSIRALEGGVVESITPNRIVIKTADGKVEQPIYNNIKLNKKAFLHADTTVKVGDTVAAGDVIADSNFTRDGTLAIGTNLRAAYIPYKGLNFEDGIVITESAAKKLASEHIHEHAVSPSKGDEFDLEAFMAWSPNVLDVRQSQLLDKSGIVRKGQIVKMGDPLWVGTRENKYDPEYIAMKKLAPNRSPKRGHMEKWNKEVDGQVVDVVRVGKKVKVYVKTLEPAAIGDKLTNRHGGKGILTKIIADGESPRTADGRPIDILLNPHGIVSRINPSQMLETAAAKMAEKVGAPYVVDNFSGEDYLKTVKANLKKTKVSDKEALFDPHSKVPLGDVLVGPQYFLKLNKQATSQFSARSDGKYDANRSPLRGGDDGAKSLDLLTFYSMLAHGSRANLREMATYKGSKNDHFWNWLSGGNNSGLIKPPPEPTFAYRKFEAYLKGAGVNMQKRGSKMVLGPMTDAHTEKLSNGEIKEPIFMRGKDLREEKGGLLDINITGGKGGEKWSHIQLAEPIANPAFEKPIQQLTGLAKAQYNGIIDGKIFVDAKTGEFADEGLTGGLALKKMLSLIDIDADIKSNLDAAKKAKSTAKLDSANKKLKYLLGLKKLGLRPEEAYIQSKIPVIPPQFRPIIEMDDGQISNPGINTLYRDVGLVNNELKWQNSIDYLPDEVRAELRGDLYKGTKAVAGLGDPTFRYPKSRTPKGFVAQIAGTGSKAKEGFFIKRVLKRNQDLVGRGTIIPEPKLGLDEVGLPEEMSWNLFKPFVTRRLVNNGGRKPIEAKKEVDDRTPSARAALEAEMAERPVLLNRAPSLHKFSVMAFKPRLTDGKAIKIPPLVVKGFNADFDGDTMTVHVPILPDAVREAEGMLPSNNLFSPGTGQIMIQPQNESALGLYQMSRDPELSKGIMKLLPKKVQTKYSGVSLNKKNLGNLMRDLADESPRDHGKVIDKLKQLGDEHTYRTGFTVGIDDLTPSIPEREGIFAKTKASIGKLDLNNPAQAEKARIIMDDANKELAKAMDVALGKQGNGFHLMVTSGARGNPGQLKQIMSSPFMVPDHKGDDIPIPITRSFAQGLKFSDYWNTLYGARTVATEKQLQTKVPGGFNKEIMATVITNVISDSDCGTTKGVKLGLDSDDISERFLAKSVSVNGTVIARAGTAVTTGLLNTLRERKIGELEVRSPLTCRKPKGTCSKCYGIDEDGQLPTIGTNIGAISGQALSEPLTQMTLRTFHSGGVSKGRGVATGYDKIDKLLKMQKMKRGKASLAEVDGKVESIRKNTGDTGKNVKIGRKSHFIPNELWDASRVRMGSEKKKGDILSLGIAQPDDLAQLKGMLPAQEYIVDEIRAAYKDSGVKLKRRAIETVISSVGNTTRVLDPGDSHFLPGDIAPWSVVKDYNDRSVGKKPLGEAMDYQIRENIPGFKKGTVIDARVQKSLERAGINELEVGPRPIDDVPFLRGVRRIPMLRDDWMSQMGYQNLKDAIVGGAHRLAESDIHGYAPVPAFAYGAEFGEAPAGKSKKEGVY
jgi:DNA-directed RNA polymerase subunit beta'